jgi:hypothetical protein
MAQSFPTSAQIIYNTLSGDSTFTDLLGTYDFKGGPTGLTALSIVSPGEDLPGIDNTSGIECIIQDAGDFTKNEYLTGDSPRLSVRWNVFLVAWEPATGADMQEAAEKACSHFLGSQAVQTVAASDGLGALMQTKIIIMSDMPIVT